MQRTLNFEELTSWIPVLEAAARLQVSRQRIYQLLENGSLVGRKVRNTWLISNRSVDGRVALLAREEADDHVDRRGLGRTAGE